MPDVLCPSCSETVRLPNVELPKGVTIQCPLCSQTSALSAWKEPTLPLAILLDSVGKRLDAEQPPQSVWDSEEAGDTAIDSSTPSIESLDDEIRVGVENTCEETVVSDTVFVAPNALNDLAVNPLLSPEIKFSKSDQVAEVASECDGFAEAGQSKASEQNVQLLDSDSYIEPDGFSEDSAEIEGEHGVDIHDDPIRIGQSASSSGDSLIQLEEDDFPSDLSSSQPSIDEIEKAWDSPDGWESQEAAAEDELAFDVADELSNEVLLKTRRDSVASSGRRRISARSRRKAVRFLKMASPSLVALLIVMGFFYLSGINLGFYPFNGFRHDTSKLTSTLETAVSQRDRQKSQGSKTPVSSRVLVDTDEGLVDRPPSDVASQFAPSESTNALLANDAFVVEADPGGALQRAAVVGPVDDRATELASVPSEPDDHHADAKNDRIDESTADIVAGLFGKPESGSEVDGEDSNGIDRVIQSLQGKADELGVRRDEKPRITVAMRAREQWLQREGKRPAAKTNDEMAKLNRATLRFSSQAPSIHDAMPMQVNPDSDLAIASASAAQDGDGVRQASAIGEMDSSEKNSQAAPFESPVVAPTENTLAKEKLGTAVDALALSPVIPLTSAQTVGPHISVEPEATTTEIHAEDASELESAEDTPAPISDSPELVSLAEQALELIGRLPNDRRSANEKNAVVAKLLAYRAVARIGGMSIDPESPAVAKVLNRLSEDPVQDQLTELCGEWVSWGRRKTDGILLIGTVHGNGAEMELHLGDGSEFQLVGHEQLNLPADTHCVLIGKIKSTEGTPIVHVIAGSAAP